MDQEKDGVKQTDTKFELVGEEEETNNWKGMLLSFIVICAICMMVLIAIIMNRDDIVPSNKTKLTLNDIAESFDPKRFDGQWISEKKFAYLNEHNNIMLFNCDGLNSTTVVSNLTIEPLVGNHFKFSMTSDPNVILISYDHVPVNRHSYTARYKLYNTITKMEFDVIGTDTFENVPLQNALLSPNGRKVAFVEKNNIYLMKQFYDGNKAASQITTDGKENQIYNGITDWLYEEEVLETSNALYWSPDSRFLAFIRFDDSQVEEYSLPVYDELPYSRMSSIRYPKVDSPNPLAAVLIYDTEKNEHINLIVPDSVKQGFGEYYIWAVKFFSNSEIIITYVNRDQKSAVTVLNDILTGTVNNEKEYPPNDSEFWNIPKDLAVSKEYDFYFQIWYIDNFANILAFNRKNGNVQQITSHNFDVTDILHVNEKLGELFYLGTNGDPKQRHVFRTKFTVLNSKPVCLTCKDSNNLKKEFKEPVNNQLEFTESTKCLYFSASFSTNGDFYALECLGDRIPITYIKSTMNEKLDYVYEDNSKLRAIVDSKVLPKKSYLTVVLDEETGETADAELYYPVKLDPVAMYPVLLFAYGSPSSQIVDYQFNVKKFEAYMTVNYDVIVASIDGRGSSANGERFLKAVYKKLGKAEVSDQLQLAKALQNEKYTSNSKFAIWGWSYGGYLSAIALLNETSPFKCGISGAPVTDWKLYDSAYTEKYMGSLKKNRKAYDESSLLEFAKENAPFYSKRSMLLVHGTGDDNVHFQNSAVLANQLRSTNLDLDFEVYPNDKHTPNQNTQRVFFKKAAKFLLNCYDIDWKLHLEALNLHHLIEIPG